MRWTILTLIFFSVTAGAIYFIRTTEAERAPAGSGELRPQIAGRLVDPIMGIRTDGVGYFALCEYDAWVEMKSGIVVSVRDNAFGPRVTASSGLPVQRGERVAGGAGFEIPAGTAGWEPGASVARVYRDQAGNLRTGCAPESVVTEDVYAPDGPPLATPPPTGQLH